MERGVHGDVPPPAEVAHTQLGEGTAAVHFLSPSCVSTTFHVACLNSSNSHLILKIRSLRKMQSDLLKAIEQSTMWILDLDSCLFGAKFCLFISMPLSPARVSGGLGGVVRALQEQRDSAASLRERGNGLQPPSHTRPSKSLLLRVPGAAVYSKSEALSGS